MNIQISDLREVCEQLFSHLETNGHTSIEITDDYYWHIIKEQKYDPYRQPNDLTLGQLTDDWIELKKITEGKSEPLGYAFVWVASILRAIGEKIVR